MILDELLFRELDDIGKRIIDDAGLNGLPKNCEEMDKFLEQFEKGLEDNKMYSILLGNILFGFITNKSIRNRQTNSRIFEDIFSGLFGSKSTDSEKRNNPIVSEEVAIYDNLDSDLFISRSMSGNKREKCDVLIDDYAISIKTLKGPVYNKQGEITDRSRNNELNVGSFDYTALLSGIIDDDKLNSLSDRTSGLGSGKQLRDNVFDNIVENGNEDKFYKKLKALFTYVYSDDDVYIVLKSHYNIKFILIPAYSFVDAILSKYKKEEETFQTIWYRWENNNLRFNWPNLIKFMKKEEILYYERNISLSKAISNDKYNKFIKLMQESIDKNIKKLLKQD